MRRVERIFGTRAVTLALLLVASPAAALLPLPEGNPRAIDFARDPLLQAIDSQAPDAARFMAEITGAVGRDPAVDRRDAELGEQDAARREAEGARGPQLRAEASYRGSLARSFESPTTGVERLAPQSRADAALRAEQTLIDFGAGRLRRDAAESRTAAARAALAQGSADSAIIAITLWHELFVARTRLAIAEAYGASVAKLAAETEARLRGGLGTVGDLARAQAFEAAARAALARAVEQESVADVRFETQFGSRPHADIALPRPPASLAATGTGAITMAADSADVVAARAAGTAARQEADAIRRARLPRVTGSLDAARYDLIDGSDYDVRGGIVLTQPLFDGGQARARTAQAEARARIAEAGAETILRDVRREAAEAFARRTAAAQVAADERIAYRASRIARDALAEQLRVARGSLLERLRAEQDLRDSAERLVVAEAEARLAGWRLLAATGELGALIAPAAPGARP